MYRFKLNSLALKTKFEEYAPKNRRDLVFELTVYLDNWLWLAMFRISTV